MGGFRRVAGFTLVELLVAMLLLSTVLVGALKVFSNHNRTYVEQDLSLSVEQNLRMGMGLVSDALRTAGYGVPLGSLSTWVPWVPGFNNNPQISPGAGGSTNSVSIATCSAEPVARLAAAAAAGATTLTITSNVPGSKISDLLDTGAQRLILIGDSENAHITGMTASSITIDTTPTFTGNQGLRQAYPTDTPICRVDVVSFAVYTDKSTGLSWLSMDSNQGSGPQLAAEDITNLVITAAGSRQYQITLTGQSETVGPLSGKYLSRTLSSNITLKN